ncbi:MAG: multicopper oxidase family protein [Pseudomonadota bacterium]
MPTRRQILCTGAAAAAAVSAGAATTAPLLAAVPELRIQSARYALQGETATEGLVSLAPDAPPPVLRMRQGMAFETDVTNTLPDYTAMHWHGIRVPNAMDGVPYLTQIPIGQGERYRYAFTPEDAGTYWYHPHCMTMDQMGRGLTGLLVVEEAEDPGFDTEIALNLRDFRLGRDGALLDAQWSARGAARAGTHGALMTANWQTAPLYTAPAGGLVRLRLAATDPTRIYRLYLEPVEGQNTPVEGRVIALDGHPVREAPPWPTPKAPLPLSPGQRADIALKMPAEEGREVLLITDRPGKPRLLARLRAEGADRGRALAEIKPLAPNPLSEPDLASARVEEFVFGWTPEKSLANNGVCGTLGYTFWSINRIPYPGDAATGAGPLATLRLGQSYVLRLRNESPNAHPIHLHGLTFRPLRSNQRAITSNWTDTALLLSGETLDVALVADNPGDWAFHCHIIEHQKTGLAGFIRVA